MADGPVRDFLSTDGGEWAVVNGDFASVAAGPAVKQGIRIRVGMWLGECYLDETVGVDYLNKVLVKNPDPLEVRAEFQEAIGQTPDVTGVAGADLVQNGRDASIAYVADSVYDTGSFGDLVKVPV